MRKLFLAIAFLFFATNAVAADFNHSGWDILLRQNVTLVRGGKASQVNYSGFAQNRNSLRAYLASTGAVTQTEFNSWSNPAQLAFLINVYNANTIELVLDGYPNIRSIRELGRFGQTPWQRQVVKIFGAMRTLDHVEHWLIRGSSRYNDPRIHFALNCAAVSCPALRPEAYVGSRLEAQLEDQTHKFLSDPTRNQLYGNELKVSSIFRWYRGDFQNGNRGFRSLNDFFIHYAADLNLDPQSVARLRNGQIRIVYLPYNWDLNSFSTSIRDRLSPH
ncbi:MAG: hypothetical protein FD163_2021 [Hyphomonadaceae bacterium]|nr:MAG: hypothetical protein FD163_2021 [Hyphomonadaceae bacterium]